MHRNEASNPVAGTYGPATDSQKHEGPAPYGPGLVTEKDCLLLCCGLLEVPALDGAVFDLLGLDLAGLVLDGRGGVRLDLVEDGFLGSLRGERDQAAEGGDKLFHNLSPFVGPGSVS